MALRSLRQRPLSSALTSFSVALGMALVIVVMLLEREAYNAYRRTAVKVEVLVAGNKGGPIDALLSTIYYVGRAPGRVAWSYYETLKADKRVAYAVPLAVGDTYGEAPVVGTTPEFFTRFEPRFLVDGNSLGPGRAVAGARTGLKVGDRFHPGHGGFVHKDTEFEIAAVGRATGTAHDKAIFIGISEFMRLKGHAGLARGGKELDAVSAILIKTSSGSPFVIEPLIKEINDGTEAQAIRPRQVVNELFAIVGDVQRMFAWVGALVLAVAALSVMVALYNTMAERRAEIAVLRALGATRRRVFFTVLLEAALICAAGGLLGMALGHGGAAVAAPFVEARAGVRFGGVGLLAGEPLLLLALCGVGCLAGVVPALTAYRVDVAGALE